ncbi:single-stranded-DNA-specific exonuclease RecJ [Desulforhopalus vacuolatus]|uniref:single-stranded-DNA-specific exonuclease RecJ n=1 Tax=Desulforhopalus vacuolatus TaxID=40414 RepID=UPI00196695E8|nr:single-stranded-DNA-specific exonuclease RecJ [Desulforhopalus vacuolatus]MBM9519621.1 single-stranded-DNA-specific exonuclease RecJ [Desulforhopalus vacuolatus]
MVKKEIPGFILQLLAQRGIEDYTDIEKFLFPKLASLPKPDSMLNLREAAQVVRYFVEKELQIIIWGDYDVDGTTATALLVNFFRELGVDIKWHIPNRLTDGYGLNIRWFEENISSFSSKRFLLITVDNGISSREVVTLIQKLGGVVVVTDHHALPESGIPDCIVVNPEQEKCGFHSDKMAGVGIAFYLAAAIRNEFSKRNDINMKSFLPFVALGTVADMVELTSTNRILVRAGFEELHNPRFTGLIALLEESEIFSGEVTSEDIGFSIGPKINAAGRLGNSQLVVEILTSENPKIAKKKSAELQELNLRRKELCVDDFALAESMVSGYEVAEQKVCVVAGKFHPGVAGIVASKLVELFGVPAIVLAETVDSDRCLTLRGSGRSVEGINLHEMLQQCSDVIIKFGGHAMAAGLSIEPQNLDKFTQMLGKAIREESARDGQKPVRKKSFDVACSIDEAMNPVSIQYLMLMEPFGQGNPAPKFYDKNSIVIQSRNVGVDQRHLSLMFRGQYSQYKGIGFGLGEQLNDVQAESQRSLVYSLTRNRYRGTESWQIRVHSL